ncbi:8849_t:CDS:2 [Diversispora eburnea]|uniref:8849_t:CDS:1 n=1 Tax=Diversispora eburnea TaxID=1213867 RepID=A0A9N8W352_9GLOM|nr:8849_t:CDS:2 [Diversispora eburnea]
MVLIGGLDCIDNRIDNNSILENSSYSNSESSSPSSSFLGDYNSLFTSNIFTTNENNLANENRTIHSYSDRSNMVSEFQRHLISSPVTTNLSKRKRKDSAVMSKEKKELIHKTIIQRTMFPLHKSDDELVKCIDFRSTTTKSIFKFEKTSLPKRRIRVFDTPFRDEYSTSPFSHEVKDLMMMPCKPERIINPTPYQMLAFCNELILKMTKLCDLGSLNSVTSVKWLSQGTQLAIGTAEGNVQIWDVQKFEKIRDMECHKARVGTIAWKDNLISTGSADRYIFHRDPRIPRDITRDQLASGGNANELFIWEENKYEPFHKLDGHKAAVRALSWSPHTRNLLVSGGGHLDRQIRFWNTLDARCLSSHNVCNLQWSPNANEIVSTHGWWKNDIVVWKYPSMEKFVTLKGHTFRVLYFALSPNGEDIVTGAGGDDNTLRFWKLFNTPPKNKKKVMKFGLKLDGLIR